MISSAKITPETTLVIDDGWTNGDRSVDLRLRPPHKADYRNEESAVLFAGSSVVINMDVLKKYNINVEIKEGLEKEQDEQERNR